ncbi:MAG: hypothetical protein AAF849_04125 [Bacteroidota bacterium]
MLKLSRVLLSLLLSLLCVAVFGQDHYDHAQSSIDQFQSKGSANLPTDLRYAFRVDAARLSLRAEQDLDNQNARVPSADFNLYYRLLTSIYASDDLAKEIAACGIHSANSISVDYVELIYDKKVSWANPLQEGIASIDHPAVNRLMEKYDLIIQSHRQISPREDAIIIRAAEPLNMSALTNTFYDLEGISKVDLGTNKKLSSDIQISPSDDGWDVHYLLYFEEDGVPQQHIWVYHVNKKWEIKFLSETGAPLIEGLNCR